MCVQIIRKKKEIKERKEMKMKKKVVFLDIDGTLRDFDGTIPESTKEAIKLARANGHEMVVCSGRSLYQIDESIMNLGIDGVIGGAGAVVCYKGKELYHRYMTRAQKEKLFTYLDSHDVIYTVQTDKESVIPTAIKDKMMAYYKELESIGIPLSKVAGELKLDDNLVDNPKVEKLVFHRANMSLEEIGEYLGNEFSLVSLSFAPSGVDIGVAGEIGIGGITKASGIENYLKAAGVDREDSIAFGDGYNDFEMIEYVNCGVAMGNGVEKLKEIADFVTDDIDKDGIYNGFKKLGLI